MNIRETSSPKNDGLTRGICILCQYDGPEREHRCTVANVKNGYELFANGKRYLKLTFRA